MKQKANPRRVAIIGGSRTPFVKSFAQYSRASNHELLTTVTQDLINKYNLHGVLIGDVSFGAVMKHITDWNLSREVVLSTTLDHKTPGYDVQRACGIGLETVSQIALKIANHQIECGIAGGSDTNSDLPVGWPRSFSHKILNIRNAKNFAERLKAIFAFRPRDFKPVFPAVAEPRTGLSMGDHTEKMVQEFKISREDQDALALASHQNAARAQSQGFFSDLIVPFRGVTQDTIVRGETSIEKLKKLKPAFERSSKGTLTAGNSSPLSDGASCVLLASDEWAQEHNLKALAYFVDAQVSAVDFVKGEGLLIAPTQAVAKLLARNGLSLQDFDFYEIHEAFTGQVLCTLHAWESAEYCKTKLGLEQPLGSIDRSKLNVNGGSVAIGHPFGATGGRIVASLAKALHQKGHGRGLISICTAGGMGVAAIIERPL